MKAKTVSILLLFIGVFIFSSFLKGRNTSIKPFIVVLDAGHGGHDPGNMGNGYKEKDKLWPEMGLCFYDSVQWLDKPKWKRQHTYVAKKIELLQMENRVTNLMVDRFGSQLLM